MSPGRARTVVAAVGIAATTAGCGLGPGPSSEGEARLTVTHDYGAEKVLSESESDPAESETVLRFLDRDAEITTRYGGGFVQSINGVSGGISDGRTSDWFFFLNGVESPVGAADVPVRGGDRIWWDYRDWTDAMRVPAIVGSWPEPFAQVSAGADRLPVRVVCAGPKPACGRAAERLGDEGVDASIESPRAAAEAERKAPGLRLLVGPWAMIDSDPAARQLDRGPATSGVFARFERASDGWRLVELDRSVDPVARLGAGAGLVAAVRDGDDPPTWLVTGTDATGVERAASALDSDSLADHYAVAAVGGGPVALPAAEGG
jgi:Domain of unknown function (DUF4430)